MPSTRQLLLINPNTTTAVTERLVQHLRPLLPADIRLHARTATFGAPYISNEASCAVAGHAVLQAWADETRTDLGEMLGTDTTARPGTPDGVLIGCFGDPGLFALRDACQGPVTGLAEASFIEASSLGRFAIVTGGVRWKPMLQRLAHNLGYGGQLAHVETVTPTGAAMLADPAMALEHLHRACALSLKAGIDSIIVGGAGLAGMARQLQPSFDLPLIDSVEAGARVMIKLMSAERETMQA